MTIRTTELGGTDWGEENLLYPDLNDTIGYLATDSLKFVGLNTASYTASFTTEREMGEITIPADSVLNGLIVIATYRHGVYPAGSSSDDTATAKIRAGTSTTGTSNTPYATDTTILRTNGGTAGSESDNGFTLMANITGLTWSSVNYINFTASQSENINPGSGWSVSLLVFKY